MQVQNCERADATVALLCAELQRLAFATTVGCNAYVSPASGTRGLRPHRDNTHTTIVQLEGTKEWTVWSASAPEADRMLEEGDWDSANDAASAVALQVELRPGDVLQIALGDPHVALCRAGPSVHLTFAHRPVRRADVFDVALLEAEQDRARSREWCETTTPDAVEAWVDAGIEDLRSFLAELRSSGRLARLVDRNLVGRRLDDDGSLRPVEVASDQMLTGLASLASRSAPLRPDAVVCGTPLLLTLTGDDVLTAVGRKPSLVALCEEVIASPHSGIAVAQLDATSTSTNDLWCLASLGLVYLVDHSTTLQTVLPTTTKR